MAYDYKGESLDGGDYHPPAGSDAAGAGGPGGSLPEPTPKPIVRTSAQLGPPVPLLWGTDRYRAIAIWAGSMRPSDGTYWVATWAGSWQQERTDTVPAVLAIGEAPLSSVRRAWRDGNPDGTNPERVLVGWESNSPTTYEWALGATPLSPSFLTGEAIGFAWQGIAQFRAPYLCMPGQKIPAIEVEATAGTVVGDDSVATATVTEMLTHATRGLGLKGSDGTGASVLDVTTGLDGGEASSFATYCANTGFRVSLAVLEQASTKDLLQGILDATNSTVVLSGGRLKFVPLGEDTINTYVPAASGVVIDDNELLHETGRDTVTVEMKPDERVYNTFPITIRDRQYSYRENTFEYVEPAHAAKYGVRRAPRRSMPWVKTAAHALKLSAILARRSISIRRTFRFRLSPRWVALEPGDIIALTHAKLGLVEEPVRIVAIEENARGVRELWCDEWPAGLSKIVDLTPGTQDGLSVVAPNPYITAQAALEGVATKANVALDNVPAGSVTQTLIADLAVSSAKLADNAVEQAKLAAGAVTNTKIADDAITTPKIAANAITAAKIGAGEVVSDKIYAGAVTAEKIAAGAATFDKLAVGSLRTFNYAQDGGGKPTAGAKLDNDPTGAALKVAAGGSGIQIGTHTFDEAWWRIFQGVDGSAGGVLVWRGNDDPTVRSGVPDEARLRIMPSVAYYDGAVTFVEFAWFVNPASQSASNTENIDTLRFIACTLNSSTGTVLRYLNVPIGARGYNTIWSEARATHGSWFAGNHVSGGYFSGYIEAGLVNAYGKSASRRFKGFEVDGNGYLVEGAWTGAPSPAPAAGGGTVGGGCPAPWAGVTLASGLVVPAASLHNGARLLAVDDANPMLAKVGTVRDLATIWKERWAIDFADGSAEFSYNHRIYVVGKGWTEVRRLRPGDAILSTSGERPVTRARKVGRAQVVSFRVEGAGTYFADGLLCHNAKDRYS